MVKEAGNEFSRATAGRNDRSTWVVGLVNFGKKVHDRSTWCGGDKVLGDKIQRLQGNRCKLEFVSAYLTLEFVSGYSESLSALCKSVKPVFH